MSSSIYATLLLAISSVGLTPTTQDRVQDPTLQEPRLSEAEAGGLSVAELLARMPDSLWERDESDDWVLKRVPAELRRRAEGLLLSDADWRAILAAGAFHTRPRWTFGEPLVIWYREPPWLDRVYTEAVAVEPELGQFVTSNEAMWCGNCAYWHDYWHRRITLQPLPWGTRKVVFDLSIDRKSRERSRNGWDEVTSRLWSGRFELPVEAVSRFEDVMPDTCVDSEGEGLRSALCADWTRGQNGAASTLYLNLDGEYRRLPMLIGVGVSLSVELRHRGCVFDRGELVADRGALDPNELGLSDDPRRGFHGHCELFSVPQDLREPGADLSGWTLCCSASPGGALRLWEADSWWCGWFELPLSEALERQPFWIDEIQRDSK